MNTHEKLVELVAIATRLDSAELDSNAVMSDGEREIRAKVAAEIRQYAEDEIRLQSSWLWHHLGESLLTEVADRIAARIAEGGDTNGTVRDLAAAAAEARGVRWAIDALRDDTIVAKAQNAEADEWHANQCACEAWPGDCITYPGRDLAPDCYSMAMAAAALADYLESLAPKEPDHA